MNEIDTIEEALDECQEEFGQKRKVVDYHIGGCMGDEIWDWPVQIIAKYV